MDTSKIYIKMCDCSEIQNAKKGKAQKGYFPNGDGSYFYDKRFENGGILINGNSGGIPVSKSSFAWLPRQDQIQEMLCICKPYACILREFYPFVKKLTMLKHYNISEHSMEQLWLEFYMDEKHSKVWDGEKWIKK